MTDGAQVVGRWIMAMAAAIVAVLVTRYLQSLFGNHGDALPYWMGGCVFTSLRARARDGVKP